MRLIVLLDVDDAEDVSIAVDEHGDTIEFKSYEEADSWCSRHATRRWVKTINLDDDDD